jgi:hypothetical protein
MRSACRRGLLCVAACLPHTAAWHAHATAAAQAAPLTRSATRPQEFLRTTEAAFRTHPLWRAASEEEIEASGEGLEKYLMTKIHGRTFAVVAEDVERDRVRP